MLRVSLPIGDDLLEIHNCMWQGKDAIYWNGELVSKKRRFFSSKHRFTVTDEYGQPAEFYVRVSASLNGTSYGVQRNGKVLLGSFRDKLNHQNRERMPEPPGLDLSAPPRRQRQADPMPANGWREEDLIV